MWEEIAKIDFTYVVTEIEESSQVKNDIPRTAPALELLADKKRTLENVTDSVLVFSSLVARCWLVGITLFLRLSILYVERSRFWPL